MYKDGTTYFVHPNHLGSTTTVFNHTGGSVAQDEIFYPWGERWNYAGTLYDERFAAMQLRDAESGLDPTLFRMYESRLYRWVTPDPVAGDIFNPQSLNRYAYVLNNPVNLIDPLGLQTPADCHPGGPCPEPHSRYTQPPQVRWGGPVMGTPWVMYAVLLGFIQRYEELNERAIPIGILVFGFGAGGGCSDSSYTEAQKKQDLIKAALANPNLARCLNKFFGPGKILTNANLPRIDASQNLPGAVVGQTKASMVPDTGRATVQIDKGVFTILSATDRFLIDTYLHETANALAIQRFTNVFPRSGRARRGPLGGPATPAQEADPVDKDIGQEFEKCLHE